MRELSIFVDESGSDGLSDRHYLLTVVMHDQSENIANSIAAYEGALRAKGLPDIPFHASPLMNGKDQYSGLDLRTRKMMLGSFRVFFRHMPVRYHTFAYATKQFASLDKLAGAMRRDIVNFLFDNLAELQSYDMVKVYYDNGQHSIAESLHRRVTPSRGRVRAVEGRRRLPIGAALRVPAFAGGGLHLHHGTHGNQIRRARRHCDGREVLRQVVRFQEGHTEGDAQEARLERRSALGGAFTDNGVCYAGGVLIRRHLAA